MGDFSTVFEIGRGGNGIVLDTSWRIMAGIVALVLGILEFRKARKASTSSGGKYARSIFMIIWAVVWLVAHIPMVVMSTTYLNHLLSIERSGQAEVTEGEVVVEHQQPKGGHAAGDVIFIGGKKFVIDHFRLTPGYADTIAHRGVLRPGVYARLHHYNGAILKVEIRKN